ncbi:hypothetical protein BKA62DRAFT_707395 [Auriculariales sp. MPI-PUGE-AT-0066]|nr:hypothetical protein BKA62DRAFT_707395 [Auriculariales sp. MPI-PUGE-AT-0066]
MVMAMASHTHTTAPPPLPAHVTRLVLRHLAPPGEPVPAEFLSTATRQRHGLLALKPSDATYYSWVLPVTLETTHVKDPKRVVAALEALNLTTLEDTPLPPPRYVYQGEGIFQAQGHVPTSNQGDLVLVFVCEGETTDPKWKLFDVRLALPDAPSTGFATIEEAAANTKTTATDAKNDVDGDANDPYWDSYRSHSPTELAEDLVPDADTTVGAGEDAYWNRYAEDAGGDTEEDEVASLPVPGTTGRQFATTRKPMFPPPPPPRSRSRSPANLPADTFSSAEALAEFSLNSPGPSMSFLPSIQTTSTPTLRTSYHAAGVPNVSPRLATPSRGIAGPSIQMPLSPRNSLASVASLSPRLPPAPSGNRPLDLPISPTFAHVQHLMHHGLQNINGFVAEPEGLNISLGTPPPTLPTMTAPLPNSPSMTLTSQLSFTGLGFDKGKARASSVPGGSPSRSMSTDDYASALAINLNPTTSTSPSASASASAGPSPSSATSLLLWPSS